MASGAPEVQGWGGDVSHHIRQIIYIYTATPPSHLPGSYPAMVMLGIRF